MVRLNDLWALGANIVGAAAGLEIAGGAYKETASFSIRAVWRTIDLLGLGSVSVSLVRVCACVDRVVKERSVDACIMKADDPLAASRLSWVIGKG